MINIDNVPDGIYKKILREPILQIITNGIDEKRKVIFLCGASKEDKTKLRYKFSEILKNEDNYELSYPEDIFEDLLEGQGDNSLLSLEEQLAEAVDLIILLPESPGSFAELGAFSTQQALAEKTLVFRNNKFKSDKSFINHGPIRLIKSYKGKVIDIPYDFLLSDTDTIKEIKKHIHEKISKKRKPKKIDNLLSYPIQMLLLIFLFDNLNYETLMKLMPDIHNRIFKKVDVLSCKAALHSLIKKGYIKLLNNEYKITADGYNFVNKKFYALPLIMTTRAKILNYQCSGQ